MKRRLINLSNSITRLILKVLKRPMDFFELTFKNKRNIIYFVFLVLVLILGTIYDLKNATADRIVHRTNLYEEAEHINYEDAFTKDETCYFVYYYVENTRFSQTALNAVTTFYDGINTFSIDCSFYLVDMGLEVNQKYWYDFKEYNYDPKTQDPSYVKDPNKIKSYEDLVIIGAPTMLYFEAGNLIHYEVGYDKDLQVGPDIVTLMRTCINKWIDQNLIKPRDILIYW